MLTGGLSLGFWKSLYYSHEQRVLQDSFFLYLDTNYSELEFWLSWSQTEIDKLCLSKGNLKGLQFKSS